MILGTHHSQTSLCVCISIMSANLHIQMYLWIYTLRFWGCFLLLLVWFGFVLFCFVSSQLSNNQVWILFICKLNHKISLGLFVTKNLFGYFKQSHKPFLILFSFLLECPLSSNMQSQHKNVSRFTLLGWRGMDRKMPKSRRLRCGHKQWLI